MSSLDLLLREADAARAAQDPARARPVYERAASLAPGRPEAALGLALCDYALTADADAATRALRRCLSLDGRYAEAWIALGYMRLIDRDLDGGASALAAALSLRPDDVPLAIRRAETASAAGQGAALAETLSRALEADPDHFAHAAGLATVLEHEGAISDAIGILEAARLVDPQGVQPAAMLGSALVRAGRNRDALEPLGHAIEGDPSRDDLRNDLSVALMRLHRPAEAAAVLAQVEASCERAGRPMTAAALCNYAVATVNLGEQEAALSLASRAARIAPGDVQGFRAMCNVSAYRASADGPGMLDAAIACASRLARPASPAEFAAGACKDRLRIGLLSGSLRVHPVGWLTLAAFEALPRDKFEMVAFSQAEAKDAMARRFRAACAGWHMTAGLSDGRVAAMIREQDIDILFDLGGWGHAGRMAVCAHRPAPVQIKWVGMQSATTGMAEMDWFVTDRWETPAGHDAFYTERLLRMPDGYVCYAPPPDAPAVAPAPAAARGYVTFGCFNTLAKLTPDVIATWGEILARAPSARLMLKTQQFGEAETRDAILARLAAAGVDAGRVTLAGGTRHATHLAAYGEVDLVLDPFPYSGGLTTCEALWMGVATLTLPGTTFASRHSTSHLSNAGLERFVMPNRDAYVRTACALARDPAPLAALRETLRPRVAASPLTDAPRFGANLAAALTRVWDEFAGVRGKGGRQAGVQADEGVRAGVGVYG